MDEKVQKEGMENMSHLSTPQFGCVVGLLAAEPDRTEVGNMAKQRAKGCINSVGLVVLVGLGSGAPRVLS